MTFMVYDMYYIAIIIFACESWMVDIYANGCNIICMLLNDG